MIELYGRQARIIRGRLVWFDPPEENGAVVEPHFHEDGALAISNGVIEWSGDYSALPERFAGLEIVDHRPHLLMPGFVDPHIHFPQSQVVASYAGSLLEWLNTYTFIEEQRYGDEAFASAMAGHFLDMLIAHGTTSAVAFASVHKASAKALLDAAYARDMRLATGKVMMDRNAPEALTDTAQSGYDDTVELIEAYHGRGRLDVAITPRFALTSTHAQMEATQALVRQYPQCLLQTHLSENHAEIETVCGLFPEAIDYTDVYDRYGLLTSKSLMGHSIHLSDREIARMAESGAVAVFCPTSNLFLGSGAFDRERLRGAGVRTAIATDIGGGTSWSMLKTLDEGYKILNGQGQRLHPFTAFAEATAGNAAAIGHGDKIGSLQPGAEADLIVLNCRATPAMALRAQTIETLAEELFLLQTMGDDRAIVETYVAGSPRKSLLKSS